MSNGSAEIQRLLDLGLLNRVVCHELNNLVANQRGYARLLVQHGCAGQDGQRWLGELTTGAVALQDLLARLQARSRSRSLAPGAAADKTGWPPLPHITELDAILQTQGSALQGLAAQRVLAIVAAEADCTAADWSRPVPGQWPRSEVILGNPAPADGVITLTIPDLSHGAAQSAWHHAADLILPDDPADHAAWARALVLGLLRQSGGELAHVAGDRPYFELAIPTIYVDFEKSDSRE